MKISRPPIFFIILLCLSCWNCDGDHSQNDSTGEPEAPGETSEPSEGFYADYEGTNRAIWQKPDEVIALFGDLENKTVADIGAGTGHFSFRLAGKAKKVIAIDIDERFIHFIDSVRQKELPDEYENRIETRLAEPDNPRLQEGEVDAVLIVNTYMYIENRQAYLEMLLPALTEGGKVLIVDFKRQRTPIGPPLEIRLPSDSVEMDLKNAGFRNITVNKQLLQYQYAVMAEK